MVAAAVELVDVYVRYGDHVVLSGLNLSIAEGENVVLLGPSGGGKSTIVRLVLGFIPPVQGRVLLGGQTTAADGRTLIPPEERNLAVVFQDLALWPHMTAHGNLAFPLESRNVPREQREQRIRNALARVGMTGKEHRYPGELSGGERQRVAISRALVQNPSAVLLDEPLSNLDAPRKRELIVMFRQLFEENRSTVLHVTHDLREAKALGDRIAILEDGRVVQEGSFDALRDKPATAFVRSLFEDLDDNGR
jgi:ABC-type sugar transport system ATPase subunit